MQDWLQFRSIIWVTLHRQDLLQWITGSVIHSCSLTDIGNGHQSRYSGCQGPFLLGPLKVHSLKLMFLFNRRHLVLFASEVLITIESLMMQR